MNRRFWIFVLLLALLIPTQLEAQRWKLRRYEGVIGIGTVHPFMDIGNPSDGIRSFHLVGTRPNLTASASYRITAPISIGLDLNYMMYGGVDVDNRLTVHSFNTNAFEHFLRLQFDLVSGGMGGTSTALFNRRGMVNNYNSGNVYVFVGFGGILSKAKAFDLNNEIVLEDNFFDNNLQYGVVFPMGLGYKYSVDAYWSFGVEVAGRLSLTDLLDGYATPYSNYNDRFFTTNFRAIYKIRNDRKGKPIFSKYGR